MDAFLELLEIYIKTSVCRDDILEKYHIFENDNRRSQMKNILLLRDYCVQNIELLILDIYDTKIKIYLDNLKIFIKKQKYIKNLSSIKHKVVNNNIDILNLINDISVYLNHKCKEYNKYKILEKINSLMYIIFIVETLGISN
ncbi:hypothetical protein CHBEV_052 [Choristoneura biennis entomopoxvirus]|uniref:Uncharacterized protein n=1 Tax=Choristoneura biennis entomopoxvirus TaxID=10288 RepID=A0A916P6L9_CBEPV|nr:hypothetical protein CHBEV_052 [Choristoneura biennis entomopoxvirus]CCU55620.1 hypothetical protein CHBEV_052 [Choristoneura biennis entomopoxvirus]